LCLKKKILLKNTIGNKKTGLNKYRNTEQKEEKDAVASAD
jgi:hypothetical protein